MADSKIPDDIAGVKPKAKLQIAAPPAEVSLCYTKIQYSIMNAEEQEKKMKNEEQNQKKQNVIFYHDIQHALACSDYLIFIAFDSSVETVSVRAKEYQAPTMCLEDLKINYICISRALHSSKIEFLLHFQNKQDKFMKEVLTLDDSELKLLVIDGKYGYYYLKYTGKLRLDSVNKLIGNYQSQGLRKLLRIGFKIAFNKLTTNYKQFLTEIKNAVTDGWFFSNKDRGIKILGTGLLGLFYSQELHFELQDFEKPLYKFFIALEPAEIVEILKPYTELEVQAFWQGMIAMSNKMRGKGALEILKFSSIQEFSSLQFDRLEGTEATLEQSFKYIEEFEIHQNAKDALFIEHVELKELRDQYLEDMMRVFNPTKEAISKLKKYVKQEVQRMIFNLKYSQKIQVRKIEELKIYIPLVERQRTRETREVMFYIAFPEFKLKTDDEVYLVLYGQKWPMQKIPNSKAYFILIELNNNIYNLGYHYQWKKEKTTKIDRYHVLQLNTVFDTPEFFGKVKAKVDKTKLFLQYLKIYCQSARDLPSEYIREMDAFMLKYFIKFDGKEVIDLIDKYAAETDKMLVLGNLVKVKREPVKQQLNYYPSYYYNYGQNQKTKYPEKWLTEITKLKEVKISEQILQNFRIGLAHYLENVESDTKLLAFSLGPKLLGDIPVKFSYYFYDQAQAKKMLAKISKVNFAQFGQQTRDSMMRQFTEKCKTLEFLSELIALFDPSEEECENSINKLAANNYTYGQRVNIGADNVLEKLDIKTISKFLTSQSLSQRFATSKSPILIEKLPKAILKSKSLFESAENLVKILKVYLSERIKEDQVWQNLRAIFNFLEECRGQIKKKNYLFSDQVKLFLIALLKKDREKFYAVLLQHKLNLDFCLAEFRDALCLFIKDRFQFQEEALTFFKQNIKPLDQQFPMKEVMLTFFAECEKKFWKQLNLPIKLPSKLLQVSLDYLSGLQDVGEIGLTYLKEIEQLFKDIGEGALKFQQASQLNSVEIADLNFYSKLTGVQFNEEKFKQYKEAVTNFEHTLLALIRYYEINKDLLLEDTNQVLAELNQIRFSLATLSVKQVIESEALKQFKRPKTLEFFYAMKNNQLVRRYIDRVLNEKFNNTEALDNAVDERIINGDLKEFITSCYNYTEEVNPFRMKDIQFLARGYPPGRYPHQIQAVADYYKKELGLPGTFANFDLLILDLQNIASLLPKLGDIDKFLRAAQVLHIDVSGDDELRELIENMRLLKQQIEQNALFSEVKGKCVPILKLFADIFKPKDQANLQKFIDIMTECQPLAQYLYQCQDMNFQDLLDVIDDTSFETDALIKDMINVKAAFQQIFDTLRKNEKQAGIKQFQAANQALLNFRRADITNLMQLCNRNLDSIRSKIEEQIDRTGSTLQKLDKFWKYTEIKLTMNDKGINVHFYNEIQKAQEEMKLEEPLDQIAIQGKTEEELKTIEEERERRQIMAQIRDSEGFSLDEFNQLIGRSLMFNAQVSGNYDQEKHALRVQQTNELKRCLETTLQIKESLQNLQNSGHFEFSSYSLSLGKQAAELNLELEQIKQILENQEEMWQTDLIQARNKFYSLNILAAVYLPKLRTFLQEPTKARADELEAHLKNLVDQRVEIQGLRPEEDFEELQNCQKLNQIGALLDEIIGKPIFRERQEPVGQQFQKFLDKRGLQVLRVKEDKEIWDAILSVFAIHNQLPTFHQTLFCSTSTGLHEIEQFLSRACFCCKRENALRPLFLMAGFDQLPLARQLRVKEKIDAILEINEMQALNFVIMYQASAEYKAHVIQELKNARVCPTLEEHTLRDIYRTSNQKVTLAVSRLAGLGKTEFIHNTIRQRNYKVIRIPLYGETSKESIINLINKKVKAVKNQAFQFHFDVYEMSSESLHIILFELLILRKLHVGLREFASIPGHISLYVEVSNTFNNTLRRSLAYLERFDGKVKLDQIEPPFINISIDPNSNIQFVARYLDSMDRKELAREQVPNDGLPVEPEKAQSLLEKYFLNEAHNPTYYQLQAFIQFLGRQVRLLDRSTYLSIDMIKFQQMEEKNDYELRQVIMENFVKLSRNFALQVHVNELDNKNVLLDQEEKLVRDMKDIKLWEDDDGFLVAFNSDGDSLRLFYKQLDDATVPPPLQNYFKTLVETYPQMKKEFTLKDFDDYDEDELKQFLLRLCADPNPSTQEIVYLELADKFRDIALTKDNVIKLAIIFLRVMAGIPVIIMGETGVGKTILIKYLTVLIQGQIHTLDVHAGQTQEDIRAWVQEHAFDRQKGYLYRLKTQIGDVEFMTEEEAKIKEEEVKNQAQKVILFFDQINTNSNVSGILKEVLIDRTLLGEPLPSNVVPIAAANPYKLRKKDADSLTRGLKIEGLKSSKLVYLVHPLPQSMFTSVWNFGSLLQADEAKYIRKIVQKACFQFQELKERLDIVAAAVGVAQEFAKQKQEVFAVSLRDLARFTKVLEYFVKEGYHEMEGVMLALFFCYYCRFDQVEVRDEFVDNLKQVSGIFTEFNAVKDRALQTIGKAIAQEDCIAMNLPLRENIFLIVVAIENQIPVILTGPPGSSKTLSAKMVYKNMTGAKSDQKFFKQKPRLIVISYQCSELSTSEGIKKVFDRAIATQNKFDQKFHKVVVILDEVGLAEKAQSNPLKVLHRLLEPPKVAMIGLSNWSLDAAKMNRAVHASRPPLTAKDLRETVLTMREGINQGVEKDLLFSLSDDFYEYLSELSTGGQFFFHGTRDFYNLISYICREWDNREGAGELGASSVPLVVRGLQRNFGGRNEEDTLGHFSYIGSRAEYKRYLVEPVTLIRENFRDHKSRHLMLITESPEQAFQHLEGLAEEHRQPLKIFYGSDFQEDVTEARAYELIYDVIYCMEQGVSCVFFGLDHIYQSFYDLLNQNYSELQGKKICRIAIGSDNFRAQVHESFKAIVVVKEQDVRKRKYDPPFLNRFEKQRFNFADIFSKEDNQLRDKVQEWLKEVSQIGDFQEKDLVPSLTEDTTSSLVLKFRHHPAPFQACKDALIWLFADDGAVRASTREPQILNHFYQRQKHRTLGELYQYALERLEHFDVEQESWVDRFGFRIVFYSPDSLIFLESELPLERTKRLELATITSEKMLKQELRQYFDSPSHSLLVVIANIQEDSRERILLVKNRIGDIRSHFIREREHLFREGDVPHKNILFHIRTVDKQTDGLSPEKGWLQVQLENLIPPQRNLENIDFLLSPITEVLTDDLLKDLFQTSLAKAMSRIVYSDAPLLIEWQKQRIALYTSLLHQAEKWNPFLDWLRQALIGLLEKKRPGRKREWYVEAALDADLNRRYNQFVATLQNKLSGAYSNLLTKILFTGERDSIVSSFVNSQDVFGGLFVEQILPLWLKNVKAVPMNQQYNLSLQNLDLGFPFVKNLLEQIQKCKALFTQNNSNDIEKKLKGLSQQAEVVTDEMIKPFLTVQNTLFLEAVVLLPSFELARAPVARRMMLEILSFLKLKNNASVVGSLWHFQTFLMGMQDIWIQLDEHPSLYNNLDTISGLFDRTIEDENIKGKDIYQQEEKVGEEDKKQEEEEPEQDEYTLSQQMMATMHQWSLQALLDTVLFDKTFCQNLQAANTEWRGLAQLLYAQLYNVLEEHKLDIDMSLMKRLEFFIQISQYLGQGYESLKEVYDFFHYKPLKERLEDHQGFTETMQFLEQHSAPNRRIKLIFYLFRFALHNELNPQILTDAVIFLSNTLITTEPDSLQYSVILLQSKHLLSSILSQLEFEGLSENYEDNVNFKALDRALKAHKIQITSPLAVLLVDVFELEFFQPSQLYEALTETHEEEQNRVFLFEQMKRNLQKLQTAQGMPKMMSLALFRGIIAFIGQGFTKTVSQQGALLVDQMLDLINEVTTQWSKEERLPYIAYIGKVFETKFKNVKNVFQKFKIFDIPGLIEEKADEAVKEEFAWEKYDEAALLNVNLQEAIREQKPLVADLEHPMRRFHSFAIATTLFVLKRTQNWIPQFDRVFVPYFSAQFEELSGRFLDIERVPDHFEKLETPYFQASLYISMLTLLTLPKNPLARSISQDKSAIETFLPFHIDSLQNLEIELAFQNETQLTRYRCTGCRKHIVWVGECGNLNHNLTVDQYQAKHGRKPQCPICHTVVGHTGYNQPYNLQRLDPAPIPKANKHKLRVTDPGYQKERPGLDEKVRESGGLGLRFGRFLTLSQIYCFAVYFLEKDSLETKVGALEHEILQDLLYEWKTLQEVVEVGQEDLTILIYDMICRYVVKVDQVETLQLSRSQIDQNVAMQSRTDYEKWFIAECVPPQRQFGEIIRKEKAKQKMDLYQSLLVEGAESKLPMLEELAPHIRLRKDLNLDAFLGKMAENGHLHESQFWDKIRNNGKMLKEAADLKHLLTWLKYVHDKLFQKMSFKDAQGMTIQDFCERNGGFELYERCAKMWQQYEGRNFAKQCKDIFLEKLQRDKTRITVFCLSENTEATSYQTWLFVNFLIDTHNAMLKMLKQIEGFKALDIYFPDKNKKLFEMTERNFFRPLKFKEDEEQEEKEFEELQTLKSSAQRAGVCDIRVSHGREAFFDFAKVTQELMELYFDKICRIDTGDKSIVQFKYVGDIDVGNKIGDVKDRVNQEPISQELKEVIAGRVDSRAMRLELLEKIDIALTFLQQAGAERELPLLQYFNIFKINANKLKLDGLGLSVKHIVHLFEILESLVFEELVSETNPLYQLELNGEQKTEVKKFFVQERKFIDHFSTILARLCIRNLRHNPKLDVRQQLYDLLFDQFQTFIDLWGVNQEDSFDEMFMEQWSNKYRIFMEGDELSVLTSQAHAMYQQFKDEIEEEEMERLKRLRKQQEQEQNALKEERQRKADTKGVVQVLQALNPKKADKAFKGGRKYVKRRKA